MLDKYSDQINLVIKHYPLSMHKEARPSSIAALAAANQGKYREMSALLFKNYKKLNGELIKQYAQEVGLDMALYEKDVKAPAVREILAQDIKAVRQVKVRGVPAVYISGKMVKNRSLEGFERIIKQELEKTK